MKGERITLQDIKGIGDKISEKIINSVGGEEELQLIVDNVDVEKIANIDGISRRKAIEIMNYPIQTHHTQRIEFYYFLHQKILIVLIHNLIL